MKRYELDSVVAETPGRWRELLLLVDRILTPSHLNFAVEVFWQHHELVAGLESRGVRVMSLPILNSASTDIAGEGKQPHPDELKQGIEHSHLLYVHSPSEAAFLLEQITPESRSNWGPKTASHDYGRGLRGNGTVVKIRLAFKLYLRFPRCLDV